MNTYAISIFDGARDNSPKRVEYTWEAFVDALLPHEYRPPDGKLDCDAFSPACYPPGAKRGNAGVEALSLWVGDFDGVPEDVLDEVLEAVTRNGWAALVHTTWSNADKPVSARLVLPLSEPVPPEAWPDVWYVIDEALGGYSDPACKDPARLYFGAFAPDTEADRAAAASDVLDGEPVDVRALQGGSNAPACSHDPLPPATPENVSKGTLERFAKVLRRKQDDRAQDNGEILRKVCAGEPFAQPGARDVTIYRLSLVLADRFVDADAESIASHFGPSLAVMGEDCPTVLDVEYKIARAQEAIRAERAAQERAHLQLVAQRIRDAFGTDRDYPYTDDEIEALPPKPRWIVQKGRSFYALVAGEYHGPYVQDEALSALLRDLAPAETAGVDCYTFTQTGIRKPKDLGRLVRDYGFVADDVAASLAAQRSYFDEESRTLVEAPCPLRKIKPRYHAEIAAWLAALAGEKIDLLLAWIANVTRLEVPCTALFLTGHHHTGKTLLPEGLSRLWTALGYPTPLEDVLGTSFNEAQTRCPLVFADERLPTDFRGRVLNAELRHYIQARRRPLRRKFLNNADLIGAVRLVISANNEEILATNENLSNHDIGAIVDRYLHVPCQVKAFYFLENTDTSRWVDSNMIAEHALWLRDNFVWKPNGRFLVHGDDDALHSRLISTSGIRSAVLQFCVGYVIDPNRLDTMAIGRDWIRVHKGKLCVNPQALVRCWSAYVGNEKCPSTGRISSTISALSEGPRIRLTIPGIGRPNYRIIATKHLVAWAERNGYASRDEIEEALAVDTKDRPVALNLN